MRFLKFTLLGLALLPITIAPVAVKAQNSATVRPKGESVDFELLTWVEINHAIHDEGKTTVIIFSGGTEQRGPQGVTGAHTFVARSVGREIALKLGNAILAPVVPYSVNRASAALPGTVGITGELFEQLNEQVAEQMIINGFKNVVLLGDHGGGQEELADLAEKLNAKHAAQGIRVIYVDDAYKKAGDDFNQWLRDHNLPVGSHAGIKDTSELLYLEGDNNWIRKDQLANAVGTERPRGGAAADPTVKRVNNGISGDARKSSPEIGKVISDLKVQYGVAQIQKLLSSPAPAAPPASSQASASK